MPSDNDVPEKLIDQAREAARRAHAPYSGFVVGAAVQTSDGSVYTSANMENAAYGVTICAEVGAIQAAMGAGRFNSIARMAVVGGFIKPPHGYRRSVTTPCGRCRQIINESASWSKLDIPVWCAHVDRKMNVDPEMYLISELLPHGFGPDTLAIVEKWPIQYEQLQYLIDRNSE